MGPVSGNNDPHRSTGKAALSSGHRGFFVCAGGAGRRSRGLTLVELVVSVVIFCIVMLCSVSFFVLARQSSVRAKAVRFAGAYGSGLVERYLTQSWDRLSSATASAAGPGGTTFTCTTTVTLHTVGSAGIKYVRSAVTWPGQQVQVEFETAVSSPVFN